MAFDLVHYFAEQIKIQKPQLFAKSDESTDSDPLFEMNALSLARVISLWRENPNKTYLEIQNQDPLYLQEIARSLTTSSYNESKIEQAHFENYITEILTLQFQELHQLDRTGQFGQSGIQELLIGQIEHLSGHAKDWVWNVSQLPELIGSQIVEEELLSLDETMKEFNQMVHTQDQHQDTAEITIQVQVTPTWAKILEPFVALVVLWVLLEALTHYVFK